MALSFKAFDARLAEVVQQGSWKFAHACRPEAHSICGSACVPLSVGHLNCQLPTVFDLPLALLVLQVNVSPPACPLPKLAQATTSALSCRQGIHLCNGPPRLCQLEGPAAISVLMNGVLKGTAVAGVLRMKSTNKGTLLCQAAGMCELAYGHVMLGWRWRRDAEGSLEIMILLKVNGRSACGCEYAATYVYLSVHMFWSCCCCPCRRRPAWSPV